MYKNLILKGYVNFKQLLNNKKGQAMTEYGLIIAIIAVAVIVVLGALSGQLKISFQKIVDSLTNANR